MCCQGVFEIKNHPGAAFYDMLINQATEEQTEPIERMATFEFCLRNLLKCAILRISHRKGGGLMRKASYKYIAELYKATKFAKYVLYVLKSLKDLFF